MSGKQINFINLCFYFETDKLMQKYTVMFILVLFEEQLFKCQLTLAGPNGVPCWVKLKKKILYALFGEPK